MVDEETQYSVNVNKAFKSYDGDNYVLYGLDLKVKSGSIYGLLGASGCGKSTLLHCILGESSLDSGQIYLGADKLKDIGYMPQDLSLENTLTIKETFEYFGALYDMSRKDIYKKITELNSFLQLPDMNSYIKNISGGQCRRVSIGVSLLHNPKIIILDEPTVGIDPVLRNDIWIEFTKLTEQQKKTIIITTHYIEEAHQANCVGFMRNGILIEEGNPTDILAKYNTELLETVFLTLCYNQESNKSDQNYRAQIQKDAIQPISLMESDKKITTNRIKALVKKNVHLCFRDNVLIFNMFLLPIMLAFFLCTGVGTNLKNMPIAIKNEEVNISGCQNSSVNGCIFDKHNNLTMSCVIMNHLAEQSYNLVAVKDRDVGEMSMKNPSYMAFIYFPNNFTRELTKLIDDRENYDVESWVYIHHTTHNFVFRNVILTDVVNSVNQLIDKILVGCSSNPKSFGFPLEFNVLVGKDVTSLLISIVGYTLAMISVYFSSVFSSSFMMAERMDGTLSRSMFAGVKIIEVLISMFCVSNIILFCQLVIPLILTYVVFSIPLHITTGLFAYTFILIFLGWIGFLFGIIAAILAPTKIAGVYAITGWSLPQFLIAGALWPLEGQPPFLRTVTKFFPLHVGGKAMNDITLNGFTFTDSTIKMAITILFSHVILLLLVLIFLGRIKKDIWIMKKDTVC